METVKFDHAPDVKTIKAKKGPSSVSMPSPGNAEPTTLFLKTEKELEQGMQRGRQPARGVTGSANPTQSSLRSIVVPDSSFGVHSLEETINSTFSDANLSRTSSNSTDNTGEAAHGEGMPISRKRKVHPKIKSAGHRIISSEHAPTPSSATASPVSTRSAESPFRGALLRRQSFSSSVNLRQPLTPVHTSPQPHSAAPSTPQSASPRSYRLSDEEMSVSGVPPQLAPASGHSCDEAVEPAPQLVMPSLSMPARRPFTEHGKAMGRMKLMVAGPKGVGKTSFIHNIFRLNENIVHVDPIVASATSKSSLDKLDHSPNFSTSEILASTKPYPAWWTEIERSTYRKASPGDILERNLHIIDTPSLDDDDQVDRMIEFFTNSLRHTTEMDSMSDAELVGMLSGDGGSQIDAMLYIFEPSDDSKGRGDRGLSSAHRKFLQQASRWTNLIPLVGHADGLSTQSLHSRKEQITDLLNDLDIQTFPLSHVSSGPFAISSAPGDDTEIIDASLLMSSQYLPPLAESELGAVVENLFDPLTMARLRRLSAIKVLTWRAEDTCARRYDRKNVSVSAYSPRLGFLSPAVTSTGSILGEPSKVLVPYGSASYYRSISPSVSDTLALPTSAYAPEHEPHDNTKPIREVITAKWAQDLTRSREKETRRYVQMYNSPPSDWDVEAGSDKNDAHALARKKSSSYPARGRLGGKLCVIDPTDPLGVLAFSQTFGRNGFLTLQIAGGCSLLAAICYSVVKYWVSIQEFCRISQPVGAAHVSKMMTASRVPGWEDSIRAFFGWASR